MKVVHCPECKKLREELATANRSIETQHRMYDGLKSLLQLRWQIIRLVERIEALEQKGL